MQGYTMQGVTEKSTDWERICTACDVTDCDGKANERRPRSILCPIVSTANRKVVAYDLRHCQEERLGQPLNLSARLLLAIASKLVREAPRKAKSTMPVFIRLEGQSLRDDLFPVAAEKVAKSLGSTVRRVGFDVCEKDLVENRSRTVAVLKRLRESGYRISLRGFGSFGASLSNLMEVGIDQVRLNHVVFENVATDSRRANIAKSMVEMVQLTGAEVVASDLDITRELGLAEQIGCTCFTSKSAKHDMCIENLVSRL